MKWERNGNETMKQTKKRTSLKQKLVERSETKRTLILKKLNAGYGGREGDGTLFFFLLLLLSGTPFTSKASRGKSVDKEWPLQQRSLRDRAMTAATTA